MNELTDYQRRRLLENPNVEKLTEKSVNFTSKFKIQAVKKYLKGHNPDDIFKEAHIPIQFFKDEYSRYCIKRWTKKYQEQGASSLKEDKRGVGSTGRPKEENLEELSYDELLAIIEIQKGVIKELKKKKALAKKKF